MSILTIIGTVLIIAGVFVIWHWWRFGGVTYEVTLDE